MELQITNFQRNLIERYCSGIDALNICKSWLANEKQGTFIRFYHQYSGSYCIVER
ncbi:MAG: hypothetical protein UIQ67_06015 [Bacteroidales bacterium]|nr:hypothetical protein [Bacteroidales bacterium]